MDEKDTNKEPETTTEPEDKGDKYETTPVIERAREEREKLEAAIAEQKAENDRTEQIRAKRELGGDSEGGQVVKPVEISDEEYADQVMEGKDGK